MRSNFNGSPIRRAGLPFHRGLICWLDAHPDNILFNGTKVNEWIDRSGTNHVFSQTTEASQPEFSVDHIAFTGYAPKRWLVDGKAPMFSNTYGMTIIVFARIDSDVFLNLINQWDDSGTPLKCGYRLFCRGNADFIKFQIAEIQTSATGSIATRTDTTFDDSTSKLMITGRWAPGEAASIFRGTTETTGVGIVDSIDTIDLSNYLCIEDDGGSMPFVGRVYGALYFNRKLKDVEISAIYKQGAITKGVVA